MLLWPGQIVVVNQDQTVGQFDSYHDLCRLWQRFELHGVEIPDWLEEADDASVINGQEVRILDIDHRSHQLKVEFMDAPGAWFELGVHEVDNIQPEECIDVDKLDAIMNPPYPIKSVS